MNKKKIIFLITIHFICIFSFSQNIDYAKLIVQKLTSTKFQGRGYTRNGNFLAAEYISGEFKRIGLLPLQNTYYQKFTIPANTFPNDISLKINDKTLKPGIDYLVDASSPTIQGKFNLLKVLRKDLDTHEKLINIINNINDKILYIDELNKASEDKNQSKSINEYLSFLKYSSEIKCKGIIINTHEKLTWNASSEVNCRPIIILNKSIDINSISTTEITIQNKFIKNYSTQNIIGYVKGVSSPDSFLVVIAHYDHLGNMGKNTYFPGANDNASGVAMLLTLAEYFSKHPLQYSVLFISLSGEEIGLLGAKEFTEHPLIPLKNIKFLVNFDLAGTGDEGVRVVNGSIYKDKFDLLRTINSENNFLSKIDIRGEACNSDHCMFYKKGVPCFYIYTQGGIKAYHDVYDISETLPLSAFEPYSKLMIKFFESF